MINDPQDTQDPNDTTYTEEDDDLKHQAAKSPAVLGSEDAFSGSTPQESPDIDEELEKVGLHGDEEGIKPLGSHHPQDEKE